MRFEGSTRVMALATAVAMSGCGGGGGDAGPCGGTGTLSISIAYNVNGRVYSPRDAISLDRSVAIAARPVAVGLPAACLSKLTWQVRSRTGLPTGLVLDATTGQLSGTAMTGRSFGLSATASVQDYPGSVSEDFSFLLMSN